jgi:hypothetical protein
MSGIRARLAGLLPRPFGIVHLAWLVLILAGCVLLVMMGGGHPPPMIFVPPLLVAGMIGHLLLLLVAWLLQKGRTRLLTAQVEPKRWPIELILIALVLGALAIVSIAVTVGEAGRLFTKPLEWGLFATVAAAHTVALVLLLLRLDAARYLIALISIGWGLALLLQLGEARPGELPIAIALIAGLAGIAAYVLRARRIRSILG